MQWQKLTLALTLLAMLLSACASSAVPAAIGDCPVSQPPNPPFVPPAGYQGNRLDANDGFFWIGSPGLWAMLPEDATWSQLPEDEHGFVQKLFWWSEDYDWTEEPVPEFQLTGERLDVAAPRIESREATNAHTNETGSSILTGVLIPSEGCWRITGDYQGVQLSYVVEVKR